jgi:hypothetical protein
MTLPGYPNLVRQFFGSRWPFAADKKSTGAMMANSTRAPWRELRISRPKPFRLGRAEPVDLHFHVAHPSPRTFIYIPHMRQI